MDFMAALDAKLKLDPRDESSSEDDSTGLSEDDNDDEGRRLDSSDETLIDTLHTEFPSLPLCLVTKVHPLKGGKQ
jgi:hypothetical protein